MKKSFFSFTVFWLLILVPCFVYSSEPVLFFSDITSGPKTGLGDGLGDGAIVTVWGHDLGSSQGNSKIYCGGVEAAHVYYWENADTAGDSGPSDMWTYHKMQSICFSIDSTASDGAGSIYVEVGGVNSNSLPFTIRSGDIYYCKTTGNDNWKGSWNSAWQTLDHIGGGAGGVIDSGDIIYICDGVQDSNRFSINYIDGTASSPISFIAYPGADVFCKAGNHAVSNWNRAQDYINICKLRVVTNGTGVDAFYGGRIVGVSITDDTCADGNGGAVCPMREDSHDNRIFGCWIHDFGCAATSKFHHTTYVTNRVGYAVGAPELGWNLLEDNQARCGLHIYDEGACGDWTGTLRIHDNIVINQVSQGFGIAGGGYSCFSMDVEIYNNIFINCGLPQDDGDFSTPAFVVDGEGTKCDIKVYNNIIYGSSSLASNTIRINSNFGGTWEWRNNIVVDTDDNPYFNTDPPSPTAASNNLWYNGGDGNPASPPSWDTNPLTSDPLFANPGVNDFHLQATSPCRDSGSAAVFSVCPRDLDGTLRPQGSGYDIGAYEFLADLPPDTIPPVISDVASSILGDSSAIITWMTDEYSTSQVEYGLTTSYGFSISNSGLVKNHELTLVGLMSSILYHYRVKSIDTSGNPAVSDDYTFVTGPGQPGRPRWR